MRHLKFKWYNRMLLVKVNYITLMHPHIKIIKFSSEFALLLFLFTIIIIIFNNFYIIIRFGYFNFPIILVLCSWMSYNSKIILAKIATYHSQNYAGTLGSSLVIIHNNYNNYTYFAKNLKVECIVQYDCMCVCLCAHMCVLTCVCTCSYNM